MLYVNPLEAHQPAYATLAEKSIARKEQAVEEFERYFVYMLLREMRKMVPKDTLLGGGAQQDLFTEMLDDAFAGEVARSGQWGIGKQIAAQLDAKEKQVAARGALLAKLGRFARGEWAEEGISLRPGPQPGFSLDTAPSQGLPLARPRGIPLEIKPRGIPLNGGALSFGGRPPIKETGPAPEAPTPARSDL